MDESGYPLLVAVVNEPGRTAKDVRRVDVDTKGKTWQWASDLGFPFNIDDMIDYCVGTLPGGAGRKAHGIFGIDKTQQKPTLTFAGIVGKAPGLRTPLNVRLATVENPQCVRTTLDEDGFTNVLVAGDGVLHIASQNCTESVPSGTILPATLAHETLNGLRRLEVTQNGQSVAVWGVNGENNLVGQSATLELNQDEGFDELKAAGEPIPLLPVGDQVQSFDAVLNPRTRLQQVFCLKGDGTVSSLQQAGDSKLWSEQQLCVPDPTDLQDVNTYSCHINVKGSSGEPLPATHIQLKSSSQVTCIINSMWVTLGSQPVKFKTDTKGAISITMPAPDLAAPDIVIILSDQSHINFNPAHKAVSKLSNAAKAGSLSDLKRQDGSLMFPGIDNKSTQLISQISDKYLGQNESASMPQAPETMLMTTSNFAVATDDHGILWQFWHGIVSGVEKILDFGYQAGSFIINTAKKVWKFVIETAEQALKALSGLFKFLGDAVEEALTWLAEKLDWTSILDTAAVFNEMFNAGIEMLEDVIEKGADAVDHIFADMEAQVAQWHVPPEIPQQFAKLKPDVDKKKNEKSNNFADNPGFNWLNNNLENDDTQKALSTTAGNSKATSLSDVLKTLFDDFLKPLWDNFKDTLVHIWDDIKKLFDSNSTMTWQDILKNIGADIALGIVRGIRKAVHGLFAVSHSIVEWIHDMLNKEIDIWVVTKLYAKITRGQKLTILNLCSLILAIPTTWVFRLLYGKKPRDIPQLASFLDELHARDSKIVSFSSKSAAPTFDRISSQSLPDDNFAAMSAAENAFPSEKTMLLATNAASQNRQSANRITNFATKATTEQSLQAVTMSSGMKRLRYVWRMGMLIKSAGVIVYTLYDTITTGLAWPTVGFENDGAIANEFTKGKMMYVAIVIGVGSFPFEKLDRHPLGYSIRVFSWACKGFMNVVKTGVAGPVKPAMAGLAGVWDLVCYVIALIAEGIAGKTDGALEWTQRMLADCWAIGSAYNAMTKAVEPIGLTLTIGAGLAMNVEGMILARRQLDYFTENATKEDYYPPSWSTSLSGSMG